MNNPDQDEATAVIARAKRLMLTTLGVTFIALAIVLVFIGYRLFTASGSAPGPAEAKLKIPAGAKVISSTIAEGRVNVTVEINGAAEILSFDQKSLKPLGRIRITQ